ncbi:hypothetical protein EYF80_054443 [Liparis tanakae]|uniref:Uncharacterized protein n=1 Tax=Liparis tanakae TaxID=230148 RepID=A0A4Z2F2M2_9TELE|nr:hypothetical protein EYF80_054443 [Liparis tanakae]
MKGPHRGGQGSDPHRGGQTPTEGVRPHRGGQGSDPTEGVRGVRQAALDAVHPQLSVQAVLGAEVVNTPRRLELEETSRVHPSSKAVTMWWTGPHIKEGFLLDVLRRSHGRRPRRHGLHVAQLDHAFALLVLPGLVVPQLGGGSHDRQVT